MSFLLLAGRVRRLRRLRRGEEDWRVFGLISYQIPFRRFRTRRSLRRRRRRFCILIKWEQLSLRLFSRLLSRQPLEVD